MKSVVIVSSTPRKGGNSEALAQEFAKGAQEAGNKVNMITLRELELHFCMGCLACQTLCHCVIEDGASQVMDAVKNADVLVFATPIYYYAVCGQLKTFLDRMNPIFAAGHNFTDVYLLTAAADSSKSAMDGAVKDVQGWVDCFSGVELAGVVCGTGADRLGTIQNNPTALNQAYKMGKNV